MLDTVNTFFSPNFAGYSKLFEGLEICKDEEMLRLQHSIPVIFISLANIKEDKYTEAIKSFQFTLEGCYNQFRYLLKEAHVFSEDERRYFLQTNRDMSDVYAKNALLRLTEYLFRLYGKKQIILLDEYDTPLQEAWIHGYWDELLQFMRGFFNSTFKSNLYLGRGLLTGITRIAKESIFSDLNNLQVVSTTTDIYTDSFGFTQNEVFAAMNKYGLKNRKAVKNWYDGFIFGSQKEIYNPWSIIGYLSNKKLDYYWIDTSSNALVSELIANGDTTIKEETELLLQGKSISTTLDEQISFSQIYTDKGAIWSLLMATEYVKPLAFNKITRKYQLTLTNLECHYIFETRIAQWFITLRRVLRPPSQPSKLGCTRPCGHGIRSRNVEKRNSKVHEESNEFIKALLKNNLDQMNEQMMEITENIFSFFDTSKNKKKNSENFYHAFVLGLIISLKNRYTIRSNRESGFGRYDICMFPNQTGDHGIVIEFKVFNPKKEKNLQETCQNALIQIKEMQYFIALLNHNVHSNNIFVYGFAFNGKKVCLCGGQYEELYYKF